LSVLNGIRVLDFGKYIAGPFCAALLGDFGADVIRIDRMGGSDDRFIMPVTAQGEGALYLQSNRNKRSIALDIESVQGREVVKRMVQEADVVIANMPPQILESLELDYMSLVKIKPDIILTASTAFGAHLEDRGRVGFDGVGQAMSGLVHMGGLPDLPMKAMVPVVDFSTALACALGTVMALMERKVSGMGQEVSASLLQTGLSLCNGLLIEEALLHVDRKASLNRSPHYAPSDIYRMKDGWIIVQVIGSAMFRRWAKMIGRSEFIDDYRFIDDKSRGQHGEFLSQVMSQWCEKLTKDEALKILEKSRIPAGPVQSPRQVLKEQSSRGLNGFTWMSYPGVDGSVPIAVTPVNLSRTPPSIGLRAPLVGEHTEDVLMEFGYSMRQINEMRHAKVI
jgi:crotonobetainyl-CoA:carnitine CoA-transferase CaiB-like acyl-CoA transferase